jgi:Zn ribbon nucleic-acid-binding protein
MKNCFKHGLDYHGATCPRCFAEDKLEEERERAAELRRQVEDAAEEAERRHREVLAAEEAYEAEASEREAERELEDETRHDELLEALKDA